MSGRFEVPVPPLKLNPEKTGGHVAFIQARMGSTRLRGKVLLPIGKRSAISHVWHRVKAVYPETVVCIPASTENDPLANELAMIGADCFRWDGPENDVLSRFAACFEQRYGWKAERNFYVMRITADCPFLPAGLLRLVGVGVPGAGYCSSFFGDRTWPKGYDVEGFQASWLGHAYRCADHPYDREHVTPLMQRGWLKPPIPRTAPFNLSHHRWTLDTPADYEFFKAVAERIDCEPPHPTTAELLDLLEREPALAKINT